VAGHEGIEERVKVMVLELMVVLFSGGDGLGVVWWKDLLVEVVLEKVKEMVKFWWSFGICGRLNGDGGGRKRWCCRCCCCSNSEDEGGVGGFRVLMEV